MINPLTFSTLACPHWSVETIVGNAVAYGYDGVEWRGGPDGHIHPRSLKKDRGMLRNAVQAAGLMSLGITAYSSFVSEYPTERQKNVDELWRYADLAAEIGAGHVRAFLGKLPARVLPYPQIFTQISKCLLKVADYAHSLGVTIAIEPHDNFVRSSFVAPILQQAPHPALKVIWDVGNTYAASESPVEGYWILGDRLAYVHLKDGWGRGDDWRLGPLGEGEVPLSEIFELLLKNGFSGALNVEWEWAWHPELDAPEIALPHAAKMIRTLLVKQAAPEIIPS
jgi:sugar phosphate isomerase/epimerase